MRAKTVARATAIAWRWPPDISATGASNFGSRTFSRSITAAASRSIARPFRSRRPRGSQAGKAISRPQKKFCAGVRLSKSARSW